MKNSVKNDLIKDYIMLKSINENLNKNMVNLKVKAEKLLKIYENLIFRFGLMDLSFCLLKNEISSSKIKLKLDINNISSKLNEVEEGLVVKLKKLKINEFEAKFLITKNWYE